MLPACFPRRGKGSKVEVGIAKEVDPAKDKEGSPVTTRQISISLNAAGVLTHRSSIQ